MPLEVLTPTGNLEKLKIAFQRGEDAIYMSGQPFGLRSVADNYSVHYIEEVTMLANVRKKKVSFTLAAPNKIDNWNNYRIS